MVGLTGPQQQWIKDRRSVSISLVCVSAFIGLWTLLVFVTEDRVPPVPSLLFVFAVSLTYISIIVSDLRSWQWFLFWCLQIHSAMWLLVVHMVTTWDLCSLQPSQKSLGRFYFFHRCIRTSIGLFRFLVGAIFECICALLFSTAFCKLDIEGFVITSATLFVPMVTLANNVRKSTALPSSADIANFDSANILGKEFVDLTTMEIALPLIVYILVSVQQYYMVKRSKRIETTLYRRNRGLLSRVKSDRFMNHHVKNTLLEVYATIALFLNGGATHEDLYSKKFSLKRALQFFKKSISLASIYERTYVLVPKDENVPVWIARHGMEEVDYAGVRGWFSIQQHLVACFFLDLSFGNAHLHGGPSVKVECVYSDEKLSIDIHNSVRCPRRAPAPLFSASLCIADIRELCHLQNIEYSCALRKDGRWHSQIIVDAVPCAGPHTPSAAADARRLPSGCKIAIVDDQRMILRLTKKTLQNRFPGVQLECFEVNTPERHEQFMDLIQTNGHCRWDIVILDQNLAMESTQEVKLGTELAKALRQTSPQVCIIMHTANISEDECAIYKSHGADGVIGKGIDVCEELETIYSRFVDKLVK